MTSTRTLILVGPCFAAWAAFAAGAVPSPGGASPAAGSPSAASAPRPILVTVDDLPIGSGRLHADPKERAAITRGLIAALERHRVPAVGFVVWGQVTGPADLALLDRYRTRYPDRAAMGSLRLDIEVVRPIWGMEVTPAGDAVPGSVHAASVAARWTLTYPDRPSASGRTLLVFRRERGAWLIVQDASM